jgi:hypothetical protein
LKNRFLTIVIVTLALIAAVHSVASEDDDEGDGEREGGGGGGTVTTPASTTHIIIRPAGTDKQVIQTLEFLLNATTALQIQEMRDNITINQLNAEILALKSNDELLRANIAYQNSTINYLNARILKIETAPKKPQPNLTLLQDDNGDGIINAYDNYLAGNSGDANMQGNDKIATAHANPQEERPLIVRLLAWLGLLG